MNFVHLYAPHYVIAQIWRHLVVGHTLRYTVSKFGVNRTNGSQDTAIFVPHPYSYSNTLPECQPLPIRLLHQMCHPWPTRHQFLYHCLHTTGCQWPDVRILTIQVPAWDLDQNLQDQGWGKTLLPALHPGQRGLCCHGQMGTSRWDTQEQPC